MRNLWNLMKTFEVLPTNEDFRSLSDNQIDLMLYSMEEDAREISLAQKGLTVDSDHYDSSYEEEVGNREEGQWEVLKEGHDADEIARQVEKLTREEDLSNLMSKFDSLEEYNEYLESGGKTARESEVEEYMEKQIRLAQDKAKAKEMAKGKKGFIDDRDLEGVKDKSSVENNLSALDKEAMDKSIELFNAEDDDEYTQL